MEEKPDSSLKVPDSKDSAIKILTEVEPRLSTIADYDLEFIANIDSTNITPDDWDRILFCLNKTYRNYNGFVITHGTDTMAYTAAALSLAIDRLGKPVVLTGSQIPGSRIESDAKRNLINAFKVATRTCPEYSSYSMNGSFWGAGPPRLPNQASMPSGQSTARMPAKSILR